MQARAVAAVRRIDARSRPSTARARCGRWSATATSSSRCSPTPSGLHLDLFQRIGVDPASLSIVRYTEHRPYVLASNTHAGDLSWLVPAPDAAGEPVVDAAVGGGAGPREDTPAPGPAAASHHRVGPALPGRP